MKNKVYITVQSDGGFDEYWVDAKQFDKITQFLLRVDGVES